MTAEEIHALEEERNRLVREVYLAAERRDKAFISSLVDSDESDEAYEEWIRAVEKYRAVDKAYMEAIHGL